MQDLGEVPAYFVAAATVDMFPPTIWKAGDSRPRTVGASVHRPFAVGSPGCQLEDDAWLLSLGADPGIERGRGHSHTSSEPDARKFTRGDQLKRLRAADAQQA